MQHENILQYRDFKLGGKTVIERVCLRPPLTSTVEFERESCFIFSVSGRSRMYSLDERCELMPGRGALVRCGNFLNKWQKATDSEEEITAIAVHFHPEVLADVYQGQLPGFLKSAPHDSGHSLAPVQGDAALMKFMDGLIFYFDNPEIVDEDLIRLKLKEMLLLLYKTEDVLVREILGQMFNPRDFRFRETIEAHLFDDLDAAELARLCGMSLANFKRKFNEVFGDSPMRYIRTRRLERSRELIVRTREPIGAICFQVGFNDLSHFNKSFKALFGKSPTAFRE